MLAKFKRVRVVGVGFYDIEGQKFYFADFHDPSGREPVIRFGISKEVPVDDVEKLRAEVEGDHVVRLDLDCDVSNDTKVVTGTNRTVSKHKVSVLHFQQSMAVAPITELGAEAA